MHPVLITTAISPPAGVPYLKMTDTATRWVATKAAIYMWASYGAERIIVADATGQRPLDSADIALMSRRGVTVEQLTYQQDEDLVIGRGKGFGEGVLMAFALAHSALLKDSDCFYKCTGKVFCRNIDEISAVIEGCRARAAFWRWLWDGADLRQWADARFYFASRQFALEKILPAYRESNDHGGPPLEARLFDVLSRSLKPAKALRPLLTGFCGGIDKPYNDSSLGALDASFPCWMELGSEP